MKFFIKILRVYGEEVNYSSNPEAHNLTKITNNFMKSQHFKKSKKYRGVYDLTKLQLERYVI